MFASFIIPTRNRPDQINRCLKSLEPLQTTKAYEVVVIDDASTEPTMDVHYDKWKKKYPFNITVLRFKEHMERIYAFNAGMLQSQGEWIIHLDSDDVMKPEFKEVFEEAVDKSPNANVFNWKGDIVWQDGEVTERPLFEPSLAGNNRCEVFKSGKVFSGGFAFKKSCLNVTGYLPQPRHEDRLSPYAFGKKFLETYEEVKPFYTMPDGHLKTDIGNPWGQDYSMFYMLTRHWMPVQINKSLHTTYVRP